MILELLIAGLLGAAPDLDRTVVQEPLHLRPVCRQLWPGRKSWEVLRLLRADEMRHVWFLLLPQTAYLAPYSGAIGARDYRGARIVEYDGSQWWQYPIEWNQDIPDARWELILTDLTLGPIRLRADFYQRFDGGDSNADRLAVRGIRVEDSCLAEVSDPETVTYQPKIGFEQRRIDRVARGLSLVEPDWNATSPFSFQNEFYFSDGRTTWLYSSQPGPERLAHLYHFDGTGWEQQYRLPDFTSRMNLTNLLEDSKGNVWLNFGLDYVFLRYDDKQLCAWNVSYEDTISLAVMSGGPNGQVWISPRGPSHGVYTLENRYRELPLYDRYSEGYPYEKLFRHFNLGEIGELPGELESKLDSEIHSQLAPIYFDGNRWHQAMVPPREPHVKAFNLEFLNGSKHCWPIDEVNRGQATLPEEIQ